LGPTTGEERKVKLTATQRKMAMRLIREKKVSFRNKYPDSILFLAEKGFAFFHDDGWWRPTKSTILATLTEGKFLLAERLYVEQFIRWANTTAVETRQLNELARIDLAEYTKEGDKEWKRTERLIKAFRTLRLLNL
jgi:hypothetical protein